MQMPQQRDFNSNNKSMLMWNLEPEHRQELIISILWYVLQQAELGVRLGLIFTLRTF